MNPDPLGNLLRSADAVAPAPPVAVADILRGVAQRHRRRMHRRATTGLCLGLLTAFGVWRLHEDAGPAPRAPIADRPPRDEAQPNLDPNWRTDLARLEHEAEQARALAKSLQLARAAADAQAAVAALPPWPRSPRELAAEHLDTAARTSVLRADTLRESFARLDEAAAAYRAVIDRFPETRWAAVAQRRLVEMGRMN